MDTFNVIASTIPPDLREGFQEFINALGGICEEFINRHPQLRPGDMSAIMAYAAAVTLVDTTAGIEASLKGVEKPDALEVKRASIEIFRMSVGISDYIIRDSVDSGDYTVSKPADCDCVACRTKRKIDAGKDDFTPDEMAELLTAMIISKPAKTPYMDEKDALASSLLDPAALGNAATAYLTEKDLTDVTNNPPKSSPWGQGMAHQEQVLGGTLQVPGGEAEPGTTDRDSPQG